MTVTRAGRILRITQLFVSAIYIVPSLAIARLVGLSN